MKKRTSLIQSIVVSAALAGGLAGASQAALALTDVALSSSTISFRVYGVVDAEDINVGDTDSLFFGFEGNSSWLTTISSGTNIKNAGSYVVSNNFGNPSYGGYLYTNQVSPIVPGTTVDYNLTYNGVFNFAGLDPSDLVVQVGYETVTPAIIGGVNKLAGGGAVPEPATAALAALSALGFVFGRRRRA